MPGLNKAKPLKKSALCHRLCEIGRKERQLRTFRKSIKCVVYTAFLQTIFFLQNKLALG